MRLFLIILFLGLAPSLLWAQTTAPKYSNDFLNIGIGARALAMGNSVVASCSDVTSGYWNPSGMLLLENNMQLGAMHSEYFAGIAKFDYLGAALKNSDSSALGLSLIRLGVDDIPNTLDIMDENGNIQLDRITSFSVADYAFMVSYARKTKVEGLSLSGNVKVIRRTVGEFASAWGFGFDLAARYVNGPWVFGALARDITGTFNAWKFNTETLEETFNATGNEIPSNHIVVTMPRIILAAARTFPVYKKITGLAEINMDLTTDGKRNVLLRADPVSVDPHLGIEFNYNKLVYLRAGLNNIQRIPDFTRKEKINLQPSLGIGVHYKRLTIDYAITDLGDASIALYSNVFSLTYSIDPK